MAIKLSDCTFTKAEFEKICNGSYEELFPQYDEDNHIIYEGTTLKFPTISEDGTIREMTSRELALTGNRALVDGERVEGDTLTYTPKLSDNHTFVGGEWVYEIAKAIKAKVDEVNAIKSGLLSTGYRWNTNYIQRCRPEKDIPLIRETIENFKSIPNYAIKWYFTNQTGGYPFTAIEDFENMRYTGMEFLGKIFDVESEIKVAITNCTTQQEIDSIDIETLFSNAIKEYL